VPYIKAKEEYLYLGELIMDSLRKSKEFIPGAKSSTDQGGYESLPYIVLAKNCIVKPHHMYALTEQDLKKSLGKQSFEFYMKNLALTEIWTDKFHTWQYHTQYIEPQSIYNEVTKEDFSYQERKKIINWSNLNLFNYATGNIKNVLSETLDLMKLKNSPTHYFL
jgi:hypothetical protein